MKNDDRVGKVNIAKNGQKMTIIAYHRYGDIDIKFEDGTIVYHKDYSSFKKGHIGNPNIKINYKHNKKSDRIGQSAIMNCGMKCTCIGYRNANDADFEFEDGTVVKRTWIQFKRKTIINTSLKETIFSRANESKRKLIEKKLTEKVYTTKYGMTYKVKKYIDRNKVLIQFEDGYQMEIQSQRLGANIRRPDLIIHSAKGVSKIIKIGETRTMKCGEEATIIEAKGARDITVKFKNGVFRRHTRYSDFVNGVLSNRKEMEIKQIGDNFTTKNGEQFTIIAKNGPNSTIKFENGEIRTIETRTIHNDIDITCEKKEYYSDKTIGMEFDTNCGLKCKVLEWVKKNTVKVEFEDGTIKEDANIQVLKKGQVSHPNLAASTGYNNFYGYKCKRLRKIGNEVYYTIHNEENDVICVMTPREMIKASKN